MSDGQEATPRVAIARSQHYRLVYSTVFKTRVGSGDSTIQFALQTDTAGADGANLIQEEVAVVMTWPVLKALAYQLSLTVEAIEKEIGPIALPPPNVPHEKFKESIFESVRALNIKKPA